MIMKVWNRKGSFEARNERNDCYARAVVFFFIFTFVITRDVHETFQTETRPETHRSETETLGILPETRPRPRRFSYRDLDRDVW